MPKDFERIEPTFGAGPVQPSQSPGASPHPRVAPSAPVASPKTPLSRAPGRKKLLVAVPMAAVAGVAWIIGLGPIAQMFFIGFLAYAIVGLVEVLLGSSLQNASAAWDNLRWWSRGAISLVVILAAFALVIVVIPLFAK